MRFALLATLFLAVIPMSASATEEPPHVVILEEDKFQIRRYAPTIVAEVEITGDMRRAGNSGFRPLADFIFGNNTARMEIAMTAPVTRTPSQKIAMTAPVTRTKSGDDVWTVAFMMPAEFTMATLPVPNNPDVSIREVPGEILATLRFAGNGSEQTHMRKQGELEAWISAKGYVPIGAPRYAGYDAPWKPAPFRRNEVMIPVAKTETPDLN